ncbi:MAG: endonuclease V [Syntrophobacteraceae bacterium]
MPLECDNWDLTPREAIALQKELAGRVIIQPLPSRFKVIGAADIAYSKATDRLVAVMLTFGWPGLELLESAHIVSQAPFPYIPGLLSFREAPPLIETHQKLGQKPDILLCDGQGIAHPRRLGLAAHLGLCLGIPTVGCAKSRLCGEHGPPTLRKGHSRALLLGEEQVGLVYCSRNGVKPLYISPGHLCDIASAKKLVSRCLGRYRVPEPLRLAHITATRLRRELAAGTK